MTTPRAFGITLLTVNAPLGFTRGPMIPFSPERERTFVTPPDVNPERHAQLAGAVEEKREAILLLLFMTKLACRKRSLKDMLHKMQRQLCIKRLVTHMHACTV